MQLLFHLSFSILNVTYDQQMSLNYQSEKVNCSSIYHQIPLLLLHEGVSPSAFSASAAAAISNRVDFLKLEENWIRKAANHRLLFSCFLFSFAARVRRFAVFIARQLAASTAGMLIGSSGSPRTCCCCCRLGSGRARSPHRAPQLLFSERQFAPLNPVVSEAVEDAAAAAAAVSLLFSAKKSFYSRLRRRTGRLSLLSKLQMLL